MGTNEGTRGDLGLYIYYYRYIILALLFVLLLGAVFELGKRVECSQSGGYRYAGKCVGIANLTACESTTGAKYVILNSSLTDIIPIEHDNNAP